MKPTSRQMVSVPKTVVRIGLTSEEAVRLAAELARMEESLHEPGFGGFSTFALPRGHAARASELRWCRSST
jgi:hypothetical protein